MCMRCGRDETCVVPFSLGDGLFLGISVCACDSDTHRMAETGTGSGRSLSSAVPERQSPTLKHPSPTPTRTAK